MTPDHAYDLARAVATENAELREVLQAVAQELERLDCVRAPSPLPYGAMISSPGKYLR